MAAILSMTAITHVAYADSSKAAPTRSSINYKDYELSAKDIAYLEKVTLRPSTPAEIKAMAILTDAFNRLKRPGLAPAELIVIRDDRKNAGVIHDIKHKSALVILNLGIIKMADNLDQIVTVLAHEKAHTLATGQLTDDERELQSQREEIEVADIQGMELALQAGFDPSQHYHALLKLSNGPGESHPLAALTSTHPHPQLRIARVATWLRERRKQIEFPKPSSLDPSFESLQKLSEIIVLSDKLKQTATEGFDFSQALEASAWYQAMIPRDRIRFLGAVFDFRSRRAALYLIEYGDSNKVSADDIERLLDQEALELYPVPREYDPDFADRQLEPMLQKLLQQGRMDATSAREALQDVAYFYGDNPDQPFLKAFNIGGMSLTLRRKIDEPTACERLHQATNRTISENIDDRSRAIAFIEAFKSLKELKLKLTGFPDEKLVLLARYFDRIHAYITANVSDAELFSEYLNAIGADRIVAMGKDEKSNRLSYTFARRIILTVLKTLGDKRIPFSLRVTGNQNLIGLNLRLPLRGLFDPDFKSFVSVEDFGPITIQNRFLFPRLARMRPDFFATQAKVLAIANNPEFWETTHYSRMAEIAKSLLPANSKNSIVKDFSSVVAGAKHPAYEHDLGYSAALQTALVQALRISGDFPKSLPEEINLWSRLSARGTTSYTDQWARKLFLTASSSKYPDLERALELALEGRLIWDFTIRLEIFKRLFALKTKGSVRPNSSDQWLRQINENFPEYSTERGQAFEFVANELKLNRAKTEQFDRAKYNLTQNMEGATIRAGSAMFGELDHYSDTQKFQLLHFLISKRDPPTPLKRILDEIGAERFFLRFDSMPPEVRALVINGIVGLPNGLLRESKNKQKLIDMALAPAKGDVQFDKTARLLFEGLLHALNKVAPYEESLAISYILAVQTGEAKMHPGIALRSLLESMGGIGTSIGQKLLQRRILSRDYDQYLESLQTKTNAPTRMKLFEMIEMAMQVPNADEIVDIESMMGAASSRVVLRVRFKNGSIKELDEKALKLLRPDFVQSVKVDAEKIDLGLEYLVRNGGSAYKRLRGLFKSVKRGLYAQADLSLESKMYPIASRLYDSGAIDKRSGTRWLVIPTERGDKNHSVDTIAKGETLTLVRDQEQIRRASHAIDVKHRPILLGKGIGGSVYFDPDRHGGNFLYDAHSSPPTMSVIDYPLLTSISLVERDALLRIIGLQHLYKGSMMRRAVLALAYMSDLKLLVAEVGALDRVKISGAIARSVLNSASGTSAIDGVFQLFAEIEEAGIEIKPEIYDYLTAISHAESYSLADAPGPTFAEDLKVQIEIALKTRFTGVEKLMSLTKLFSKPKPAVTRLTCEGVF